MPAKTLTSTGVRIRVPRVRKVIATIHKKLLPVNPFADIYSTDKKAPTKADIACCSYRSASWSVRIGDGSNPGPVW